SAASEYLGMPDRRGSAGAQTVAQWPYPSVSCSHTARCLILNRVAREYRLVHHGRWTRRTASTAGGPEVDRITIGSQTGPGPSTSKRRSSLGWLTTPVGPFPRIHIVDDPPPSRFIAVVQPSARITAASSGNERPEASGVRPSTTTRSIIRPGATHTLVRGCRFRANS